MAIKYKLGTAGTTALATATNWTQNADLTSNAPPAAPGAGDIAYWKASSLAAGLTGNMSPSGIEVEGALGNITFTSGTVTVGTSGIMMRAPNNRYLSFSTAALAVGTSAQTWTIYNANSGVASIYLGGGFTGSATVDVVNGDTGISPATQVIQSNSSTATFTGILRFNNGTGAYTSAGTAGQFGSTAATLRFIPTTGAVGDTNNCTLYCANDCALAHKVQIHTNAAMRVGGSTTSSLLTIGATGSLDFSTYTPTLDLSTGPFAVLGTLTGSAGFTKAGANIMWIARSNPASNTLSGTVTVSGGRLSTGYDGTGASNVVAGNQLPNVTAAVIAANAEFVQYSNAAFTAPMSFSGAGTLSPSAYTGSTPGSGITYQAGALAGLTGTGISGSGTTSFGPTAGLDLYVSSTQSPIVYRYNSATVNDLPRQVSFRQHLHSSGVWTQNYLFFVGNNSPEYDTDLYLGSLSMASAATGAASEMALYANQNTGPLVIKGPVRRDGGTGTLRFFLRGSNKENNALTGNITETNGVLSITKENLGRWVLAGNNAHSGGTTVNAGTLVASNDTALGTGGVTVASAGTLELRGGLTVANGFTSVQGPGDTVDGANYDQGAIYNADGSNTLSGTVTLAGAATIKTAANTTLTLTGTLAAGANTLTKTGAGVLKPTGPATGAAAVAVNAGTLYMSTTTPNTLPTGGVTVADGATLACASGSGLYSAWMPAALTLNAGSTLLFGAPA